MKAERCMKNWKQKAEFSHLVKICKILCAVFLHDQILLIFCLRFRINFLADVSRALFVQQWWVKRKIPIVHFILDKKTMEKLNEISNCKRYILAITNRIAFMLFPIHYSVFTTYSFVLYHSKNGLITNLDYFLRCQIICIFNFCIFFILLSLSFKRYGYLWFYVLWKKEDGSVVLSIGHAKGNRVSFSVF